MARQLPSLALVPACIGMTAILLACSSEEHVEDPCEGIVCDSPPADHCDGSVVVTFEETGTCREGDCDHAMTRHLCPAGQTCEDAECVPEPLPTCEDVEPCDTPPADYCQDDVLVTHDELGTCEEGPDGATCVYESTEHDCLDLPEDRCEGNVLVSYVDGACEIGEDGPECFHTLEENDCGDAMVCGPGDEGRSTCFEPVCGLAPPPESPGDDGGYCDRAACADEPECRFGFNFDFESWVDDEPLGFYWRTGGDTEIHRDDDIVSTGGHSARLVSTSLENRDLRSALLLREIAEDKRYTYHAWYQYDGRVGDAGFLRAMIWALDDDGTLDPDLFAFGSPIHEPTVDWEETVVTSPAMDEDRNLMVFLRLRASPEAQDGVTTAWTDDWAVTLPHDFTVDANARDDEDFDVVVDGNEFIGAAINNAGALYVSTNGADVDEEDRLLYVWIGGACDSMVAPPWGKSGTVAAPTEGGELIVLMQRGEDSLCAGARYDAGVEEWQLFDGDELDASCTDTEGPVLAGMVDLSTLMGISAYEVPAELSFAAAAYGAEDGGGIVEGSRLPASEGEQGEIGAGDTVTRHRASLLAGKVH